MLTGEGLTGPSAVSISLVDDDEIRRLNRRLRGIDRATDVLSFPLVSSAEGPTFVLPPGAVQELGDIVISYPRALAQAGEYGHSAERELGYLVAHGLLHILGHDHEEAAERALMRAREEAALAAVGLRR